MLPIEVNAPQGKFLSGPKKFRAYVAGFGAGKTYAGCVAICKHVWEFPRVNSSYFAPTYPQIRDIFYPTIELVAETMGLRCEIREGNKEVHFYSGAGYRSTCICRSMERPQSIVGFNIGHGLVDEIDVMETEKARLAWRKIIARMRYKEKGLRNGVDVTTTPEGFKFTYQQFAQNATDSYSIVHASTHENAHNLPEDYISSLYETYPAALIEAYIKGQFVNLTTGTVYHQYRRKWHDTAEEIQPKEPIYIGQDFNVGNMSSAIAVRRGKPFHFISQLVGIYDTPHLIQTLKEKFPEHHITIYPDASGSSRRTVDASTSDISMLQQAGISVRSNKSNPLVKDRVLSVNTAISKGNAYISTTGAPDVADALEKQAYDKNGEPDKKTGYDHMADAVGYLINYEFPIVKPVFLTGIRMAT